MSNTPTPSVRSQRVVIYYDGKPHPDLVVPSGNLQVITVADASELKSHLENDGVEGVVADEAVADESLVTLMRKARETRPELELLCCGEDISVLERVGRDFDGFVFRAEDILEFSDSVRLVLDRCCARRRHGAKRCKHTHVAAGRAKSA